MNETNTDSKSARHEPIDFHHPYTPYDVQLQFMRAVYDVLEKGDGHVGILESPTGTVRLSPNHSLLLTAWSSHLPFSLRFSPGPQQPISQTLLHSSEKRIAGYT